MVQIVVMDMDMVAIITVIAMEVVLQAQQPICLLMSISAN
jgi:hypothetical protein